VPVGLSDVVAVSAGQAHSVALKADGTVKAWGPNWGGECDVPEGLSTVVAVSAGAHHTVALTASGTLVAWGENGAGQCAVPKDLSDVTAVVAGAFHTVALKADGTVTAWGHNGVGQCDVPKGLSKVVAVAAGASHTVALQADGTLVAWGTNDLGIGEVPSGLAPAVAVAAGYGHTLALRASGGLTAWGANWQGQCDVPALSLPVVAFAGGEYHSVAVVTEAAALPVFAPTSGTLIPSGGTLEVTLSCAAKDVEIRYTLDGSVPTESSPLYAAPLVLSSLTVVKARAFMPGGTGNRMATATYMKQAGAGVPGTVVAWGSNWSGQCQVPAGLSNSVAAVAAGYAFTLALKTDGTVAAWGEGDKDGGPCAVPAGLSNVVAVAAGDYSALALRADGTVAAWGGNDFGQCNVPAGLSDVVAVASGSALSLALRRDGTVVAWGANWFGQTTVPAGLANVVAIAAGGYHAVALKADGTVVAWGDNEKGLFDVPAGLRDVVAVAAGGYFTAALKRDGTVVQWGVDFYGRFVVPAGLTGVIDISGGKKDGIVALKSDGTVVGWGPDDYGRYDVPEGLSNVVAVAAGQTHTVALVSVVVVEAPVLAVTPHELAVAAMAGEAAFNVTNSAASGRPLIWKASVVSGDWARVVSGMVGTNSGVVSVAYGANADGSPERQAVVRVHAVGSTNGVDVTVTQAASRTTPLSDFVATHPGVPFRSAGGAWYHSEAEGRDAIRSAVPSRGGAASLTATVQGPGLLSFDWKLNTSTHDIGSAMTMSLASRVIESYVAGGVGRVTLAVPSGLQKITWTVRRGAVAGEVYGCVKSATWQPLLAVPADSAQPWSGCALRSGRVDGLAWGAPVLPREGTSGFRLFAGWRMRALTLVCETQEAFVAKDQFAAVLSKAGARPFYWRVDTFVKDGRGREAASRGSLWNLTALPDDVPQFVSVPQDGSSGAEPADEFPAVTLYAGVACSLGPFSVESSSLSARVAVAATGLPSGLSVGVASEAGVTVSGVPSAVAAGLSGRTYRTVLQLVEFRNGVARQGAAAAMTVTVLPLGRAAGTYTGFMDDGQSRRGLSSMTVQTDGAISGRVKIGAANYMFSAKAFEGITNGNFYAHMVAKTDMAATPSEYPLDLEVSPEGGVTCMFDRSLDALILARNNWKEPGMATLLRDRYEGYYTVAVPRAGETASEVFPGGTGYLTMTVAAAGEVKIAGVLADGVSVSGATTLLYSTDDDTAYVPVYLTPSAYKTAGSGLFVLMAVSNGAASAKDPSGRRLNSLSGSGTWVNRDPWCVYGYASGMESNRMGFAEEVVARGGYYDKTQNLQDYYAGQALRFSGEAAYLEALDFGGMDGSTGYLLDQLPNGVDVAVSITGASILKLTLPPRSNVYTPGTWLTDFDASTNPWNVKLNAVKATGVISGSFNLFFAGGEDPAHKTKMVSLKGILLPHRGPSWETDDQAEGFYLFPDVGAYLDPQGVERTYPFNWSRGFRLSP
jgi:alpha-tubulin suppressor-like RCC1 family protein